MRVRDMCERERYLVCMLVRGETARSNRILQLNGSAERTGTFCDSS